jgi:RNA methyltransferase, TrmH family
MDYPSLPRRVATLIRRLHQKNHREREGLFLVEGSKSVHLLLQSSYQIELLVGEREFLSELHNLMGKRMAPAFLATGELLAGVSALQKNESGLAVVRIPPAKPLRLASTSRLLALADIQDPGNLGTIIRIADWFGLDGLVCSPHTVELYNPKVIQASMGSFLHLPIHYTPLSPLLRSSGLPIIATVLTGGQYLEESRLPEQGFLLIGNESHGLPKELLELATHRLSIRRHGQAESLNAAIAAAIFCQAWSQTG